MKTLILFFLLSLFLGSCGGSDDKQQVQLNDTSIIGTWQLVGSFVGTDVATQTETIYANPVVNGYFYTFKKDGSFLLACTKETTIKNFSSGPCYYLGNNSEINGRYNILQDKKLFFLDFQDLETEVPDEILEYTYELSNNNLRLWLNEVCEVPCFFEFERKVE